MRCGTILSTGQHYERFVAAMVYGEATDFGTAMKTVEFLARTLVS